MSKWKQILIVALVMLMPVKAHAQLMAVNTDAALLLTQTYNAGIEVTVGQRSTLGATVFGNYHPWILKDMRLVGLQPEWRYYFSGRPMMYHFFGVSLLVANYDFDWKDEHHHGDAAGAGLTFGYVLPLSERLNLDFHAGAGWIFYHEEDKGVGSMILPTKLGISLSYIIR